MLRHILKGLVLVIAMLLAFTTSISLANDLPPLFEAAPTELEIGETTTFSILYCPGTEPYKAEWDFDANDETNITVVGTKAQIMLPVTWLYDDCGAYSVILTITDSTSTTFREEKVDYISVTCCIILGDANGDGVVNALDITKIERIIAGLD